MGRLAAAAHNADPSMKMPIEPKNTFLVPNLSTK